MYPNHDLPFRGKDTPKQLNRAKQESSMVLLVYTLTGTSYSPLGVVCSYCKFTFTHSRSPCMAMRLVGGLRNPAFFKCTTMKSYSQHQKHFAITTTKDYY